MKSILVPRARFLMLLAAGALTGCSSIADALTDNAAFRRLLIAPERLDLAILGSGEPLAREYSESEISPDFRQNGFDPPSSPEYQTWARDDWRGYRLQIGGLVRVPRSFSLLELRSRFLSLSQITRHDCVEGWSVIGKWTGPRVADVIAACGPLPQAKYVVFHCMDVDQNGTPYYESLDIRQAAHPQALLAYGLNDRPVPVKNGAPLRLKVPTQLGYKSAKYVSRIELVASLGGKNGNGGYWEDQGYEWYAGI